MRWTYFCPHCNAGLNPDKTITLVVEYKSIRTLIGLHPQPGNYKAYFPPGVEIEPQSECTFYCPVCHEDLAVATEISANLCAIDGLFDGEKHQVYFSRVAGEQATFVISADGMKERLGRDVDKHSLDLLDLVS
jgi:hypothetical protein